MDIGFRCFDIVHLLGESATHSPVPRSACHAALLLLAGSSPLRRRALPDTPITALASAFNCRIQVEPFALSLSKGFDKLSLNGRRDFKGPHQ